MTTQTMSMVRMFANDVKEGFLDWSKKQGINGEAYFKRLFPKFISFGEQEFMRLNEICKIEGIDKGVQYANSVIKTIQYLQSQIGS